TMTPAIAADESMKDKTKDKMDTAKEKMGSAVDTTKEKTAEVKDSLKNKMSGAKGSTDVRKAQQALTDQGFHPGPVDGKMGPQTKAALSEYQKKENRKVPGRLDHETKTKLIASAPAASPATTSTPSTSPSTSTDGSKTTPPATAPAAPPAPADQPKK